MIAAGPAAIIRATELDLRSLFPSDPEQTRNALESLVADRLSTAGVWESARTSDGIEHLRIVECEPERLRICGRIFTIDQTLHSFWFDLERTASASGLTWALYFDVVASSLRRERSTVDSFDHANQIDWRVTLASHAEIRDGALVVAGR